MCHSLSEATLLFSRPSLGVWPRTAFAVVALPASTLSGGILGGRTPGCASIDPGSVPCDQILRVWLVVFQEQLWVCGLLPVG